MKTEKPKSAFPTIKPKIDPAIAAKLKAQSAPAAKATSAKPGEIQAPGRGTQSPSVAADMVKVTCEIWLEVLHDPEKLSPVWAYIVHKNPPGVQRIGVVFNSAHWPVDGALARNDIRAARWLFSVALLERLTFHYGSPVVREAKFHLNRAVLGADCPLWQSGLWSAYPLKDHELTAPIEKLPIFGSSPDRGPHMVASFPVSVDSGLLREYERKWVKMK